MSSTDIKFGSQVFDLVFHPTSDLLFTGLLSGDIKAFNYSLGEPEQPLKYKEAWGVKPTKKSCRGLALDESGDTLYSVGKERTLHVLDTKTGSIISSIPKAHDVPINRISYLSPQCLATGDDDGVIKLWDPRIKASSIAQKTYTHHWDYISSFLYFDDKKQLVSTSGDATLSVVDVRGNKAVPQTVSESQDDELLSIVAIKGGSKALTGSSMGILSVWDRSKGWRDCMDRIPGHPHSIETIVPLSDDIVATGSSDGMIRLVSILPSSLMGVIAHHDDYPIERLAINSGMTLLGSASHDECVKLTDIRDLFGDDDEDEEDPDAVTTDAKAGANEAPVGPAAARAAKAAAAGQTPWAVEERFDWSEDMETDDADDDDDDSDAEMDASDDESEQEESTEGESERPPPPPAKKGRPERRERLRPGEGKSRDEAEDKERSSFFGGL